MSLISLGLMGQYLSDAPCDIATLIFDLFVLRLCNKFELRRPFRSEDMTHFRFQQ